MKQCCLIFILCGLIHISFCQTETQIAFRIGDFYEGGIIFSLDNTGKHGLIATPDGQEYQTCWGKSGWTNASFVNEGMENTKRIVAYLKDSKKLDCIAPAAYICDTLSLGGYFDWYLPSINELKEMYDQQKMIGGFISTFYCSSTEFDKKEFWVVDFRPGVKKQVRHLPKAIKGFSVRCVRKF